MPHIRKQIRDAIATAVTGLTTTGSRVHKSRVNDLAASELPLLAIYTTSEQTNEIEGFSFPRLVKRTLTATIEGYVQATSGMDNTLDAIVSEVETALGSTPTLGGLSTSCSLDSLSMALSGEQNKPVGVVRMAWSVRYNLIENAPNTPVS